MQNFNKTSDQISNPITEMYFWVNNPVQYTARKHYMYIYAYNA